MPRCHGTNALATHLEIGNRHMEMPPLLDEFVVALRDYTGCAVLGIETLDEDGHAAFKSHTCPGRTSTDSHDTDHGPRHDSCVRAAHHTESHGASEPARSMGMNGNRDGVENVVSLPFDDDSDLEDEHCHVCGCKSLTLISIRLAGVLLGFIYVADPRPYKACQTRPVIGEPGDGIGNGNSAGAFRGSCVRRAMNWRPAFNCGRAN